jgi:quinol monooxygenase YgiN
MIHEVAILTIDPAKADAFEAAVAQAKPYFEAAEGMKSFGLRRSIETPGRYHLVIEWTSVEVHMVDFRESENFQRWRELAGPFFTGPVEMEHVLTVI